MATVADVVKESLLGATLPADLTQESRTTFLKHARQDANGDLYMEEEDFINAIAPPDENYVSIQPRNRALPQSHS
jgi:solute carrier family 25 aspartate/glutamate transporter 12/13